MIVHFKTEGNGEDDTYKVNWKDVETTVRKNFPRLKIVYSRADQFEGDLALSSHKLKSAEVDNLTSASMKIGDRDFSFFKTSGEDLKAFW